MKSIKMFGKSVPLLAILMVSLLAVGVGARILLNYGIVHMSTTVQQSVTIVPESDPISSIGGNTVCVEHTITNAADIDAAVKLAKREDAGVTIAFMNTLRLVGKDANWEETSGEAFVKYTVVGGSFDYTINATGLESNTDYVLIYYADEHPRFEVWGGNPALDLGKFTSNEHGVIVPSLTISVPISGDLPYASDWNNNPDPDYTSNAWDTYVHASGAKLWLVPLDCYDGTEDGTVDTWAPTRFLFETDLIRYFDNTEGEIVIPNNELLQFDFCYTFAINGKGTMSADVTLVHIPLP